MARWKTRILPSIVVVLLLGLGGWTLFLRLTTDVAHLPPAEVRTELAEIRAGLPAKPPLLLVDPAGEVVPNPAATHDSTRRPRELHVRVYDAGARRLVRVDLPFWWVRLKSPVFEYALRKAGVDPARLGVTADDLKRHGPGTVIDEERPDGGVVLVWTE